MAQPKLIRMTEAYGPWERGEELECLQPGEDVRPSAVDAARFAKLLEAGLAEPVADDPPDWPLATPPREYLDRWPSGPQADLARELLGLTDEDDGEGE